MRPQEPGYNFVVSAWYRVTLSDEEVIARKHMELQQGFETVFLANRWPNDAAMFSSVDTLAHHFYFSPAAVRMAKGLLKHSSIRDSTHRLPISRPPHRAIARRCLELSSPHLSGSNGVC